MIEIIAAKKVSGIIQAPASKSVAQRAIAIASLAEGTSEIFHPGHSDDVLAAIRVCRTLGAHIEEHTHSLKIKGGIQPPKQPLDCGEAGLGIRMFAAIAATLQEVVTLTGSGSLVERPMDMICQSLEAVGVSCQAQNGKIPVVVKGPLPGGVAYIDGSVSSQVLTGLLIASTHAMQPVHLKVNDLKSRPYVEITTRMMNDFGVEVQNKNFEEFFIPAPQAYRSRSYTVEGDWSGAAFMLVAASLAGELVVENLDMESPQADRAIMDALQLCGAHITAISTGVRIKKAKLEAFTFDATHCPDLFPPLVALAAGCNGITNIKGVSRLKVKESDRSMALVQEFSKLGLDIRTEGDMMYITGGKLKGGQVHSHHDHRIAMACAVASLLADAPVAIEAAESVAKSYPAFFEDIGKITAD